MLVSVCVCVGLFCQEGVSGEPVAVGTKPKARVKSVDLPIEMTGSRQLDRQTLNNFIEYEVCTHTHTHTHTQIHTQTHSHTHRHTHLMVHSHN